ncbi:MAG TPA: pre-peptidase C-terminal domain-containing protein [Vicinamibacterales bacterium]|nr:pre-peptidase C-terminal domain-containing protein [Vicinamibacterales bacterium]
MATRPHVCVQRVLPADLMRHQATVRRGRGARAIIPIGKLWMNGTTLRVRFLGGTAAQQAKARQQALWWTQHANLTFDFNNAPDAEIRVSFDAGDGAWSYVGTDNRGIPLDQPTMNLGFMDGGTAGHEFGHAIGMAHEHQNPAGGIEWNEAVVIRDLKGPPNNWTEAMIRHNVLNKYRVDQINGTAFDANSIMLYFFPGTWVKSGVGTHANDSLSAADKRYIGSAKAYPKTAPTVIDAKPLTVGARRRTAASIGTVGEEDLFTFAVTRGGTHIIDTRGPTDVVMKLFGPDSPTAVIAEDDDSGVDTNALIRADLTPGVYYVQVRHYNRARGMGKYTVKVRRA